MVLPSQGWRAWSLASLIAVTGLVLVAAYVPGFWLQKRSATTGETIMYYFAQNLGESVLCDRISWAAYQSYSVLFGGGGASFFRSDCYDQVAITRRDPGICWKVRPLVDFDPFSPGYSALSCHRRALTDATSVIGISDDNLIATFERAGYDIDRMGKIPGTAPAIRWQDVYWGLERNGAALARAQQLLLRADGISDAMDRSYVAQLAAIGTSDPKWCAQIPATQTVDHVDGPFRDWCYLGVSVNKDDTRICEQMTPAVEETKVREAMSAGVRPGIAVQMGLRAECERGNRHMGPRGHYAPDLPRDEATARRLLEALGVTMPAAHDLPKADIARLYRDFLSSLWPRPPLDSEHEAARRTLVARLAALPIGP